VVDITIVAMGLQHSKGTCSGRYRARKTIIIKSNFVHVFCDGVEMDGNALFVYKMERGGKLGSGAASVL
jgi:hypothetical protein